MEAQRGEETRQDLETGSPDAVLSPPKVTVTFKLCLFEFQFYLSDPELGFL